MTLRSTVMVLTAASALLLASCDDGREDPEGAARTSAETGVATVVPDAPLQAETPAPPSGESVISPDPEAAREAMAEAGTAGAPGAASEAPFYVGTWAASEEMCEDGWWRISEDSAVTAGESSCTLEAPYPADEGFASQATCTAEGQTIVEEWVFLFPNLPDHDTMDIKRGEAEPVSLVRCPGEGTAP